MKLYEAIEILKNHNEWRRDDEFPSKLEVTNPVELGIAIDIVVKSHEVIKELENIMERWNLGREEDSDVVDFLNEKLKELGYLSFFNK